MGVLEKAGFEIQPLVEIIVKSKTLDRNSHAWKPGCSHRNDSDGWSKS